MNRRGFLSSLLKGAIVSAVAPSIFIPKLIEVPKWKVTKPFGHIFWEGEVSQFNRLDYCLANMEIARNADYIAWQKFLGETTWQPNLGETKRAVII